MTTFATITEPPRDRFGRPLIVPPNGGDPIPYTRISTLAKELDSKDALMAWKQRMVVQGVAKRPDLLSLAAAAGDDKRALADVVKQAMAAAESDRAANIGTALHKYTELLDANQLPANVPAEHLADLHAYEVATAGLEMITSEQFVVTDAVQAAGTFDRLVRLPDGRLVVADLKTGQSEPDYPHGVTTQVAVYARGSLYEHGKGRLARLADLGVSQEVGLMIHLPAGAGRCDLYLLDLTQGWTLAQIAVAVRAAYKGKPATKFTAQAANATTPTK